VFCGSDHASSFDKVQFRIYTAPFVMLMEQTKTRLLCPASGVAVEEYFDGSIPHVRSYYSKAAVMELDAIYERRREGTLYVFIFDECHWGPTHKIHGMLLTHKLMEEHNVLVVQFSATPYNMLTSNSRVPKASAWQIKGGPLQWDRVDAAAGREVKDVHIVDWSEAETSLFSEHGTPLSLVIFTSSPPDAGPIGAAADEGKFFLQACAGSGDASLEVR